MTEITLLLSPADAARLHRLPLIKSARTGRTRGQAVRIVWHDSLDRTLASRGLTIAEERGTWRLERHCPDPTDPWPPATDHRVIEEANEPGALGHALPDPLIPVAAFEGRRTMVPLTVGGEPVILTILDGVLRAVAAERPATRLVLLGAGAAVRTLALSLTETLPLSVARHGLAADALCLADGTRPAPRRHGAPALPPDSVSVAAAFAHIVGHLTDVMLYLAPLTADAVSGVESVHQIRVAVRRARSAFSLFPSVAGDTSHSIAAGNPSHSIAAGDPSHSIAAGDPSHSIAAGDPSHSIAAGDPSHHIAAEGLKRLSQILGPARDWDVFMTETAPPVEAVLPEQPRLRAWLRAGERHRRGARAALSEYLAGPEFRLLTIELACLAAAEPEDLEATPLPRFAASVLQTRWKKLVNAGKGLDDLDNPGLHRLRLKAKRLRYASEFFAPLFPEKSTSRFIRRLAALQERLGVFNDTHAAAALSHALNDNPGYAAGLVLGFTAARGAGIKPKIARAWARFRRREPFWA